MKKFDTIKVTFETYISLPSGADGQTLKDAIFEKLSDKMEMFCTDNAFGFTEPKLILELEND